MEYLNFLIGIAQKLDSLVVIERDSETHRYKVHIYNVRLKEKYVPIKIYGQGFTVEDSSYDFIRLARGSRLMHDISNKWIDVI